MALRTGISILRAIQMHEGDVTHGPSAYQVPTLAPPYKILHSRTNKHCSCSLLQCVRSMASLRGLSEKQSASPSEPRNTPLPHAAAPHLGTLALHARHWSGCTSENGMSVAVSSQENDVP